MSIGDGGVQGTMPVTTSPVDSQGIGCGESCEKIMVDKGSLIWSRLPILSTPLGVYHVIVGVFSAVVHICRIASSCLFHKRQCDAEPALERRNISWIREEDKNGLHEAIDTIIQGILEIIPVIGNLAIHVSKWRCLPLLNEQYKEKFHELDEGFETAFRERREARLRELEAENQAKLSQQEQALKESYDAMVQRAVDAHFAETEEELEEIREGSLRTLNDMRGMAKERNRQIDALRRQLEEVTREKESLERQLRGTQQHSDKKGRRG